jgi:leucyl aminopeptidase (aminopeptidase T)
MRFVSLAHRIIADCLRITEKDNVTIFLYPHTIPLAEELSEECFKKGADVLLNLYTEKYMLSYYNLLSAESLRQPSVFCRALAENSTAEIWAGATYDPAVLRKIPAEKGAAAAEGEAKAHHPITEERKVRSIGLGLPLVTKPRAKAYGFNFAKWEKMMSLASNVDYGKLAQTGKKLKEVLSKCDVIRVTGPGGTDLSFSVRGRKWFVSDGVVDEADVAEGNLGDSIPAGSIYAPPVEDSASGGVTFNVKEPYMGVPLGKLTWSFKEGRLVKFAGDATNDRLKADWERSTGDKDRIAYFSIGFNPKAEPGYTVNNIAQGAVSIGIGGNSDIGGANKSGFFMLRTTSGASVTADGKAVLKNGKIVL